VAFCGALQQNWHPFLPSPCYDWVLAVLGMSPATVSSWPDGHHPRPGFRLRREKAGAAVWWTVALLVAVFLASAPA